MQTCYVADRDWLTEERNYVIAKLEAILRAGVGSAEDLAIAKSQLEFYKSDDLCNLSRSQKRS